MALTITTQDDDFAVSMGNRKVTWATIAFDSSYPTGGESLTPHNLGLRSIQRIEINPTEDFVFSYDSSNQKVKVFHSGATSIVASGAEEVQNGVDLSSVTGITLRAEGY